LRLVKKLTAILFALLIVSTSFTAFARASDQIDSYGISLFDLGNGSIRLTASINGTRSDMMQIGFPVIVLYEEIDGQWSEAVTIYSEYNYNSGAHRYQFEHNVDPNNRYQAYASFFAMNSKGSDIRSAYSNVVSW
jgi:hypothetical protein